jgi:hypothetical protein
MTARYCPNKKLHISLQGFTLLRGREREREAHSRETSLNHSRTSPDLRFTLLGHFESSLKAEGFSVPDIHTEDGTGSVGTVFSLQKI